MALTATETAVLEALTAHADEQTWRERKDGWAEVTLDDARRDRTIHSMEAATFSDFLKRLADEGFYKKTDDKHGLVYKDELPPPAHG
jgi:hypothetical protein